MTALSRWAFRSTLQELQADVRSSGLVMENCVIGDWLTSPWIGTVTGPTPIHDQLVRERETVKVIEGRMTLFSVSLVDYDLWSRHDT